MYINCTHSQLLHSPVIMPSLYIAVTVLLLRLCLPNPSNSLTAKACCLRVDTMAGGGFASADGASRAHGYGDGRVTISVVVTCLMAASCGLIFGYDIGVSGAHVL